MSRRHEPNLSIKGYLAIRIALPTIPPLPTDHSENRPSYTSYMFLRDHRHSSPTDSSSTLFVANAPTIPQIPTQDYLMAFFQHFGGNVLRVTVAQDPRTLRESVTSSSSSSFLSYLDHPLEGQGRFAHVVFASSNNRATAKQAIQQKMRDILRTGSLEALALDDDCLQRLVKEAKRKRQLQDNTMETTMDTEITGIHAVVAQARQSRIPRQLLLERCNEIMEEFELTEAEAKRQAIETAGQPDDDGFITVTHGSLTPSFAAVNEFEDGDNAGQETRGSKRSRKRKIDSRSGAGEFHDFYRFQWREMKKKQVTDLKQKFEEDLKKVKKMKEERAFRPF